MLAKGRPRKSRSIPLRFSHRVSFEREHSTQDTPHVCVSHCIHSLSVPLACVCHYKRTDTDCNTDGIRKDGQVNFIDRLSLVPSSLTSSIAAGATTSSGMLWTVSVQYTHRASVSSRSLETRRPQRGNSRQHSVAGNEGLIGAMKAYHSEYLCIPQHSLHCTVCASKRKTVADSYLFRKTKKRAIQASGTRGAFRFHGEEESDTHSRSVG